MPRLPLWPPFSATSTSLLRLHCTCHPSLSCCQHAIPRQGVVIAPSIAVPPCCPSPLSCNYAIHAVGLTLSLAIHHHHHQGAIVPSLTIEEPLCRPSLSLSFRCAFCCHHCHTDHCPCVVHCHRRRIAVALSIPIAIAPTITTIAVAVAIQPSIAVAVIAIGCPSRHPLPPLLCRPSPLLPSLLPLRLPLSLSLSPLHCHRTVHCQCRHIAITPSIAIAVSAVVIGCHCPPSASPSHCLPLLPPTIVDC